VKVRPRSTAQAASWARIIWLGLARASHGSGSPLLLLAPGGQIQSLKTGNGVIVLLAPDEAALEIVAAQFE
jgi:hypothetical protein